MKTNKSIAERLRLARKTLGLTQIEIAKKLGVSQGFYSNIENQRYSISSDILIRLANIFNINPTWLLTGEGEMFLPEQQEVIPVKPIPIIDVYVPAGVPEMPPDKDQIIDYLYLPVTDLPNNNLVAIRVRGNSMYPTIKEGELVVFETNPINIRNGDIVIVRNEWNELMLKRYRKRGEEVYLVSDNPEYPVVKPNELYKIVGKVVKIVSVRNP